MTDRDPAAPAILLGQPANLIEMHPRGIKVEIEMKIDVEIEMFGNLKDTRDMLVWRRVGIGAAADQISPRLACSDKQLFGSGIVGHAFLREHADFEFDRPAIVALQPPYG